MDIYRTQPATTIDPIITNPPCGPHRLNALVEDEDGVKSLLHSIPLPIYHRHDSLRGDKGKAVEEAATVTTRLRAMNEQESGSHLCRCIDLQGIEDDQISHTVSSSREDIRGQERRLLSVEIKGYTAD